MSEEDEIDISYTGQLPLRVTRQIDSLCDEYEAAFTGNKALAFAFFVDQIDAEGQSKLLAELMALANEYLRSQGVADLAAALLANNQDYRSEIEAFLRSNSSNRKTELYDLPISSGDPTSTSRHKKSSGLRIRCPHCSNHVEVVGDTPFDSVDCTVCGSNFSLVDHTKATKMATTLKQIDRFELVSRLGMGGFGTVWKARDTDLDRVVAVKIPRHGQLSATEMELFFREARAAAQLRHPNIVPIHEVGREEDTVFIVSDLIRGVSLQDMLTGRRPEQRETVEMLLVIANALEHAHQQGVVHRDLKPSNIMIDDSGQPYLMDFGLAKREVEEVSMTIDGQIIGTPAYMSPEQAGGKSAWADRRTDIYSLGVMLFELLTSELPFRGNAQMQVHQRLHDDAPNVRSLNRHIPKDLATICAKCLEREPGRRYQTAKEVSEEFSRFLDKIPIKARPLSSLERFFRWTTRRPTQAALIGLVSLLAIVGPSAAFVINRQRSYLAANLEERNNLIDSRESERQAALAAATDVRAQLDLWEGRENPWELWPPNAEQSPKSRQLASLLSERQSTLELSSTGQAGSGLVKAQSLLALATLYEVSHRVDDAAVQLQSAVEILQSLRASRPQSTSIALALADCYDQLSRLTAAKDREASLVWLERSRELRAQIAKDSPQNARLQASWLDSELRSGAAAGFEDAEKQLAEAKQIDAKLSTLWPMDPTEIYRLTCELAGQPALLLEEELTDEETSDNPPTIKDSSE